MTTKYKIIVGFLLMTLIQAAIATLGYLSIQESSTGFTEYRRLARFNLSTSDMETYLTRAASNVYQFVDSRNQEFMKQARSAVVEAEARIKESGSYVIREDRKAVLGKLIEGTKLLNAQIQETEAGVLAGYKQYLDSVQTGSRSLQDGLLGIAQVARDVGNIETLYALNPVWEDLCMARSVLSLYAQSRLKEDSDRAAVFLKKIHEDLALLGTTLKTEEGRKSFAGLTRAAAVLTEAHAVMEKENGRAEQSLMGMVANLTAELKASHALSSDVNEDMNTYGPKLLANNESAQTKTLIVSLVGLLVGVLCATLIIFGIVRMLKDLSGFAGAVAQGNFGYQIKTRERGEIGGMVDAMRQIPAVLEKVMREADALANLILGGRFRDRLDAASFAGGFSDLAKSVNAVSNAYTEVLDSLPLPLMTSAKDNKVQFLNSNAQKSIGGNLAGVAGSGKAGEKSASAYGAEAMSRNEAASGEASIAPKSGRMDIAVTAMPLHDTSRSIVGYMEIVTDLTSIKAQQNTMMQVAREASAISDRVAAASEELSTQVEQVSRGAEMQRVRVESTASAMTEMNSTVMEVARNAGQASEQSEGTRQKAEAGAGLVNKVVLSINTVNAVAITLQGNMQELGKQAENIGGVMNVISDIADQTNLLALNAAIEAARAGEAGRGFAVVADEVRKLAEKTMSATQEVGNNIKAIQHSAHTNITEVGNAVKNIAEATGLANSSGEALKEIVDLAAANSSVVASIATAAEEQSATSEEINRAIEEINIVVGETTQGMIQSSAAVHDLSRMAQDLHRVMEQLR